MAKSEWIFITAKIEKIRKVGPHCYYLAERVLDSVYKMKKMMTMMINNTHGYR